METPDGPAPRRVSPDLLKLYAIVADRAGRHPVDVMEEALLSWITMTQLIGGMARMAPFAQFTEPEAREAFTPPAEPSPPEAPPEQGENAEEFLRRLREETSPS